MSSRTSRSAGGRPAKQPEPADFYPRIQEPKQGHVGHLLAFLSVLAVLGFGFWTAFSTLTSPGDRPAAKTSATAAPTQVAGPVATAVPSPATSTPSAAPTPSATVEPGGTRVHVVAAGDTLFGIAQRYRTTVEAIMAANGITDRGKILRVGDRLVIP